MADPTTLTTAPPDDPELLRRIIADQQGRIAALEHRLAALVRRLYGPRAERFDAAQLLLFARQVEAAHAGGVEADPAEPAAEGPAAAARRGGHGRRPLPADLPRHRVEHPVDPADVPCPGCGRDRERVAEAVSEQLEYAPASLFVLQHVRPTLACKRCEAHLVTADMPAQPVEKGLPGPGLVAHVITGKYADHLPLYRLESVLARHGADVARSTMCGWMAAAAALLRPLARLMADRVRTGHVIHTDDTPVPVLDPACPGRTKTGRLWAYVGDAANPYVAFDYTASRSRDGPAAWLAGYKGFLQADAFGGYDGIYAGGAVVEVACWAHARRKFHDARDTDPLRCGQALALVRELYAVERDARDLDPDGRLALRRERSVPVLGRVQAWLDEQRAAVLPKSPVGQAVAYALKLWPALTVYAADGRLGIDNNAAERALRRVAVGRKNWLFAGSDAGGATAAVLYGVIASAHRHGLDPEAYLRGVLARIPATSLSQLGQFLPDRWKAAAKADASAAPTGV